MPTYTTTGSVRGSCGHKHRTITTAYACLCEDQRGCKNQGGYSDRDIVLIGKHDHEDEIDLRAALDYISECEYNK
jgi:hypothetical protein